jgi:hypothetical protein
VRHIKAEAKDAAVADYASTARERSPDDVLPLRAIALWNPIEPA